MGTSSIRHDGIDWGDAVISNTVVSLSWQDRIRVLFGRKIHLRVTTFCENTVGATHSESSVYVEDIFPHRPEMGQAEAGTP